MTPSLYISEIMIKSVINFLIIFFIFEQLQMQISQMDMTRFVIKLFIY